MVVVHQQKRRDLLYDIHMRYFYIHLLLRIQGSYIMQFWRATSLYFLSLAPSTTGTLVPGGSRKMST